MTPSERESAVLGLVAHMSYREAAARLDISRAAVAGIVYRARHVGEQKAPRVKPARVQDDRWSARKLTERWADRQRRKAREQAR